MLNLLSVDWDYFFPNQEWFDWGHSEKPIFLETAWTWRAGNKNLLSKERAIDVFRPDPLRLKNFWSKTCGDNVPSLLVIADSHADISNVFSVFKSSMHVYNFDAHHDLGYLQNGELDCGSWASYFLNSERIEKYTLIYPEWRKAEPEAGVRDLKDRFGERISIRYEFEFLLLPKKFDILFICRSSAWTPTWSDDEWLRFIHHWKSRKFLWRDRITCAFVNSKRSPNLDEAKRLAQDWEEQVRRSHNGS